MIVKKCYDFTKLLRKLTSYQNDDSSLFTSGFPDEKSALPPEDKNSKGRGAVQEDIFHGGRNFK